MQDRFPWLVQPTDDEFERLWQEGTFVFDANVLLDLYRKSRSFKDDFFDVLEALNGRVWLPHQVAEEFLRNRSGPIASQLGVLSSAEEKVKSWYKDIHDLSNLRADLEDIGDREGPIEREVEDLLGESEGLQEAAEEYKDRVLGSIESLREDLLPPDPRARKSEDDTLAKLEEIFEDRVGDPYDEEELQDIYQEGSRRFSNNIPPGFGDADKKERESRKYADLVIWKQIVGYASDHGKDVVFVTRDKTKDDWFEERSGRTVGPRTHLRKEFHQEAETLFWVYSPGPRFLNRAKDELGVEVKDTSIEEARQHEGDPPASGEDLLAEALSDVRMVSEMSPEELQDWAQRVGIGAEILRSQKVNQLPQTELQKLFALLGVNSFGELIEGTRRIRQQSYPTGDIEEHVHFTGDPESHPEPPEGTSEGQQEADESEPTND